MLFDCSFIEIAVAMLALAHRSDGQQTRPVSEQLKLAAVMPRDPAGSRRFI
jgi:hypothetical protein